MTRDPLPQGSRSVQRPLLLVALLVLATLLAGCVTGETEEQEDEVDLSALTFGDGRGVGDFEPLIPLTNDTGQDAQAILDVCKRADSLFECSVEHLEAVVGARGSIYAFDLLEEMADRETRVLRLDHSIAHELGKHALHVYGTIGETLATCSEKVFQGCLHGAMQEYFGHIEEIDTRVVQAICPDSDIRFERYACVHGLGHGLTVAAGYNMSQALDWCALLPARSQGMCYGGVFMENVVAWMADQQGGGHLGGGAHHDDDPIFWIREDDLLYPCNAVDDQYKRQCWLMQTSLILKLNGGDFKETAEICATIEERLQSACFNSLGRDAGAYVQRNPKGVSTRCAHAPDAEMRGICIKGFIATIVNNFADPAAALGTCRNFTAQDKAACYEGLGSTGRSMSTPEELEAVCARAEEAYVADCRKGARLD